VIFINKLKFILFIYFILKINKLIIFFFQNYLNLKFNFQIITKLKNIKNIKKLKKNQKNTINLKNLNKIQNISFFLYFMLILDKNGTPEQNISFFSGLNSSNNENIEVFIASLN